jgi:predicted nucleic acid-binding protein
VVVDASVAAKWVIDEPDSDAADALFDQVEDLIAPNYWLAEVANTLLRRVRIGDIGVNQVDARVAALLRAPVRSLPIEPYVHRAFHLAVELAHPIYDCLYLAVALHHDAYVITADKRFVAVVVRSEWAERVRLLGHTS